MTPSRAARSRNPLLAVQANLRRVRARPSVSEPGEEAQGGFAALRRGTESPSLEPSARPRAAERQRAGGGGSKRLCRVEEGDRVPLASRRAAPGRAPAAFR